MRRLVRWIAPLGLVVLAAALVGLSMGGGGIVSAAEKHGFDRSDLDLTCKACQNFFQYATGGWTARNPVQPAYPSWGRFSVLQDQNEMELRHILEEAANNKSNAPGSIEQKIGDFYASCMDTDAIKAAGMKPIEAEMARIGQIQNLAQLQTEVAQLQTHGTSAMFYFSSGQDDKDSTQIIAQTGQGGLGLPDRDYYTKQDDRSKGIREKYEQHISRMFVLAGDAPDVATAEAHTAMTIETQLAEASKTAVQLRDPLTNYHKVSATELQALMPDFSWSAYFRDIGAPNIADVNVGQPEFMQALNKQLTAVPLTDWKTYLRWHLLHSAATALSSKFVDENFDFFDRTLTGSKELTPRWKRCVNTTDRMLGEALGQKYVADYFPPQAKAQAHVMVENLVAALRSDLQTLPWMSEPTRQQALAKLASMTLKIGYPDKWRDYSAYVVVRTSYIDNLRSGRAFEFQRAMDKIGKPVDRTEWEMTPPTVNAYYDAEMNEIVFPAGILQFPFFDAKQDSALNYGAIGAVIGHEMTHAFDDEGSQYDAQGNLRNWWTPEDRKNFDERAACIAKQFDGFVVAGDTHENGKLVLGESIADLGGLTISHMAFENSLKGKPAPRKKDGFTAEQQFFLAFARVWGTSARPEYEQSRVMVDPHPLPRFRVTGVVQNMPEFAAAFDCQAGDPMVPAGERCKIW